MLPSVLPTFVNGSFEVSHSDKNHLNKSAVDSFKCFAPARQWECVIYVRLCNNRGSGLACEFLYVPRIFTPIFLWGRRRCWLRLSCHWSSCWVGGTLCCPSQGSVISGRRWCLLDWPLDSTGTRWTLWQVRETFTKLFALFITLLSVFFCPISVFSQTLLL